MRVRPYEVNKGETNRIYHKWIDKICASYGNDTSLNFNKTIDDIIADFDAIKITNEKKPNVGVVGEILVKFHPDANNHIVNVIEDEGGEAVMPGIIDFVLYCLYSKNFAHEHLGTDNKSAMGCNFVIWLIERYRKHMRDAMLANKKFAMRAPNKISETAHGASRILELGHNTGEGWFLTGEMIELIEHNVPNICCIQPFACLPNHVTGKGMIREIRRQFPQANIIPVDYDPGASEVNQLNRIKLMMATAFSNMKA